MILNPEVQKKVQAEIDLVVGRNRFPNATDRARLYYATPVSRNIKEKPNHPMEPFL